MKILGHLLLLILFVSCQKEGNEPSVSWESYSDVAYGADVRQKLDIYLPSNRDTNHTKIIFMIHGGAWSTGDKSEFNTYVDTLKKRLPSYAIVNVNYRLVSPSGNFFPTQENDIRAAYDFIVSKTSDYRISKKIVLLGASAGAHLALLQGYKSTGVKAKAIVDFFGPTDMAEMHDNPLNPLFTATIRSLFNGATPSSDPAAYASASPIGFVSPDSPPTIILQGGMDPLVAVTQSTSLRTKLQANAVVHEYLYYPGEAHGWEGANLTHSFNSIQAFLNAHVN